VCKERRFSDQLICNDWLVSGKKFSVLTCINCHFAFTQDFPSEDEIGKYYEASDYISHTDTNIGIINKLYHVVRKISLNSKAKLINYVSGKKTGNLLDIGAGTGYFLNKIKQSGWNVTGIEKAEIPRQQTKERFGIECFESEYLFKTIPETFDIVTMWHVLEHVQNLNETVKQIHSILKPGGAAIIALPNKNSTDAKYYKENWAAYDVPRHLWHFSADDFEKLVNNHKFTLEKIKPMYFDGFYISMISEQNKGTKAATTIGLIKAWFLFLPSLLNKKKSSSLIYIIRKNS